MVLLELKTALQMSFCQQIRRQCRFPQLCPPTVDKLGVDGISCLRSCVLSTTDFKEKHFFV